MRVVRLYGREGCHLCEEARQAILAARSELPAFELVDVDIESDDELLAAFLERIPVVEVDGEVVSELHLDAGALRAKLDTLPA